MTCRPSPCRLAALALSTALAAGSLGCIDELKESPERTRTLETRLQQAVDAALASGEVYNATVRVVAPRRFVYASASGGEADPDQHIRMTSRTRFRIFSIAKPMTAALVLRLWERGRLDLDAPVADYLDDRDVDFDRLHVFKGRSYGRTITVRQLLQHRSGLPDWFADGPVDANGLTGFVRLTLSLGPELWDPRDSIRYASEHLKPFFPPGAGYHYSDTNYSLLGLLVERLTGRSLASNYRQAIFEPLHMRDTYLQYFEPPPSEGLVSHAFLGPIDLAPVNLSVDWGGGGVVSTTEDLDRFARALFKGDLFRSRATLDAALDFIDVPPDQGADGYGLGVERTTAFNTAWVGHYGFFGAMMLYDRDRDISVIGTVNAYTEAFGPFVESALTAVEEELGE